ncbi:MAG TPA: alginate lyase family protein [Candidatus Polarisedimenticolia bacterium]|nr:alginate lyase family protein [Candidatus Polarisedimenticolia bacterium]
MRLDRLLRMGPPEVAERGRQQARKWLDRSRASARSPGREDPGRLFRIVAGLVAPANGSSESARRAAAAALLERFREGGAARFFAGATDAATPAIVRQRMPEEARQLQAEAGTIRGGRFNLLGYRGLSFGDPIDWRLDPVSGRRSPLLHWSRLDPLDPEEAGDCKIVWELNRHQWLVRLGQAFRLTGDEKHALLSARLLGDWLMENPPGLGINWASSLEVALRLVSWSWALHLLRDSRALTPDFFLEMLGAIHDHAAHVERYLSRYFSPNTHLTGEALGLFYAGAIFPELRAAARWRTLGSGILVEESRRQVLPDGVHFELSTCYHVYTIDILLHFLVLAGRIGLEVPADVSRTVQRMLDFLLAVRRPDGSIPPIGDGDGGLILPLARRRPDEARSLFSIAAALFHRPDYAWAAKGPSPETVWLLGPEGLDAFEALQPEPPAAPPSRLFPSGGYAVMADGWAPDAHHLIFDTGPLGCPVSGAHGHADLLSLQLSAFGKLFLPDPGTYCYTPEPRWRDHFRGTSAHSTVVIDGQEQAEPAGPFSWRARPRAQLRRFTSNAEFDFADADHDAYGRLPDPVIHRRRVLFARRRYWLVVDDILGAADHTVELRFQFAPMVVTVGADLWARAWGCGRHDLHVRPFSTVPLEASVRERNEEPIEGWIAPAYGARSGAPALVYRARTRLPLRIVTLLLPTRHPLSAPPIVSPLLSGGSGPVGVLFREPRESVRFDEDGYSVERA